MRMRRYSGIVIVALTLFITYLHYSSIGEGHTLHSIYRELYYIPVLLGALAYGLTGALLSYLLVFVLYLPYVIVTWPGSLLNETNRLLPLLLQGLFAGIAGYLVDRERRHQEQLEKEQYLSAIGRAATVIAHDLKNPLFAISGFAERIKEGKGKTEAAAQVIINSAAQMEKIVHDVLDFAKPAQLELKKEDMRDIVRHACDSCRIKAEQKGVALSIDLPSGPVNKDIDSFHMERALMNLITNAIEASGREQRVSITLEADGGILLIRILDQGPGMEKEAFDNLFVPFYTKKRNGTGLGMSIAKKVIEGHSGKIRINSTRGEGTEVTIELPYEGQRSGG